MRQSLLAVSVLLLCIRSICGSLEADLLSEAEKERDWMVGIRRDLHKIPEIKFQEFKTSAYIR